jgi:magnesium transporter
MKKIFISRNKKVGLPPGTLVYVSDEKQPKNPIKITIFDFNEEFYTENQNATILECVPPPKENKLRRWINVDGVHDLKTIEQICNQFKIHTLVQEDIVNTEQRPKVEEYPEDEFLFFVIKMLYNKKGKEGNEEINEGTKFQVEQISLILGKNYILSFQETIGDIFDNIRDRIRSTKGKVRKKGPDYLTYLLLDAVIDNYFIVLERIGEDIEELENNLITNQVAFSINEIYQFKREILILRKSTWPMKELTLELSRSDYGFYFENKTLLYLRDVHDHIVEVTESIEIYREILAELVNQYISIADKEANDVMKVLTVIATIFIPLTFISSVYGMNLNMPEIQIDWFYPFLWVTYIVIGALLLFYFKKKKWI